MKVPLFSFATFSTLIPTNVRAETSPTSSPPSAHPNDIDVVIPAEGLDLVGTLRLPDELPAAAGVVLVHGSGPNSRDQIQSGQLGMQFGFEIPVFAQIAEALRERGVAVLTYDKRSCGSFNLCSNNSYPLPGQDLTIDSFVDDASAAVMFLQGRRDEVRSDRISVVGHSQGGEFVTVMLEDNPNIRSGVILQGPFHPIDHMLSYQSEFFADLLVQAGVDPQKVPAVVAMQEMVKGVEAIRAGSSNQSVAAVSADFWRSWFDLNERSREAAAVISQPLLVLGGGMDWNVPSTEIEAWSAYLLNGSAPFEAIVLPCITHALNCISESDPTKITPADVGRSVHENVTNALADFINPGMPNGSIGDLPQNVGNSGADQLGYAASFSFVCGFILFAALF